MAGPEPYGLIEDGGIAAQGERIAWVGARGNLPYAPERCANTVVDLRGRLVTPGLIDAHTHVVYAGNRAAEFEMRLAGWSYAEIARNGGGIASTVRATRAATFEDLFESATRRLVPMMNAGVTTIEIKSGYGLDRETELRMLRVARALGQRHPVDVRTTFLGAHTFPAEFASRRDDYVAFVCDVMREGAREGLIDAVDCFCESIAFSPDETRRIFRQARDLGIPVKIHAGQLTRGEGAAVAAEFRALSADHCEHFDERDVERLRESGTVVVLLPSASYFLNESRTPPIASFRASAVPMAVASDCNPGTSPLTSLLVAMNMACVRFGLTCVESVQAVTVHAAKALGLHDRIGTLEEGKSADFALWHAEHPAELPYGLGQTLCAGTVKRGRFRAGSDT
jgi:imidazolonepropionase